MRRRKGALGGALLYVVIAACASDSLPAPQAVVRDSTGIEIIENYAPIWAEGEGWQLSPKPLVSLGMLDGPEAYQFFGVYGARRLKDGELAVANGSTLEIRLYARGGAFLGALGRRGSGPGEFEAFSLWQALPGDTIAVYDRQLQRLSFIEPVSGEIRSSLVPLHTPRIMSLMEGSIAHGIIRFPSLHGRMSDGSLLISLTAAYGNGAPGGLHRDTMVLVRYDATSEATPTIIGRFLGTDTFVRSEVGRVHVSGPPFAAEPHFHVSGRGFVYGHSSHYEIGAYAPDGTLQRLIRRAVERRPVTSGDLARLREEQYGDAKDPQLRRRFEQTFEEMPVPETHPAFEGMLTDDASNLWVRESRTAMSTQWMVFGPEGRLLGPIEMPARFRPTHIGVEHVVGVHRDELGVEYVQVYELIKP